MESEDKYDLTKFTQCLTIFRRDYGEEISSFAFRLDENLPVNDLPFLIGMLIRNFVDLYDKEDREQIEAQFLNWNRNLK